LHGSPIRSKKKIASSYDPKPINIYNSWEISNVARPYVRREDWKHVIRNNVKARKLKLEREFRY
jgi:hypothetical protein